MNENQQLFASALRLYVSNSLLNDKGWESLQGIVDGGLATIEIGLVNRKFHIEEIKCSDVSSLEKELTEAKKRIKQLESQMATPEEEAPATEETEEVKLIGKTPAPKRTARNRTS